MTPESIISYFLTSSSIHPTSYPPETPRNPRATSSGIHHLLPNPTKPAVPPAFTASVSSPTPRGQSHTVPQCPQMVNGLETTFCMCQNSLILFNLQMIIISSFILSHQIPMDAPLLVSLAFISPAYPPYGWQSNLSKTENWSCHSPD